MSERETEKTKEDKKRREELYDKFRDDLLKRQLSNSEHYDKLIDGKSGWLNSAFKFLVISDVSRFLFFLYISCP